MEKGWVSQESIYVTSRFFHLVAASVNKIGGYYSTHHRLRFVKKAWQLVITGLLLQAPEEGRIGPERTNMAAEAGREPRE